MHDQKGDGNGQCHLFAVLSVQPMSLYLETYPISLKVQLCSAESHDTGDCFTE